MKPYYSDERVTLYLGKAEDVLLSLPDSSVSLIATDPPYFRVKDEEWDRQWDSHEAFVQWIGVMCVQWRRVLRPNGSLYVFASPEMATSVELEVRRHFNVLNSIRWRKPEGWHNKAEKESLRSLLSPWEAVIFAEQFGFRFESLLSYIDAEREAAGMTPEQVNALLGFREQGGMASRKYFSRSQFYLPTEAHYQKLREATGRFGRPYSDLRGEYDALRRPFFLTAKSLWADEWNFPTVSPYPGKHPCEKPVSMLEHIVTVSSNPGDTVLDSFVGYGATLQAAKRLGRRAIGIEADERCCRVTVERLRQGALFGEAVPA